MDHYAVLGLDRYASMNDVRRAFKKRAFASHPDKNPEGETVFKQVAAAYQVLSDENRRGEYNHSLRNASARPPSAPAAAGSESFYAAEHQTTQHQHFRRPSTARQPRSYPVHQEDIINMMRRDVDAARKGIIIISLSN
eukprot:TRINITY_DN37681_c0_g1_i1.p1 TRINITY_DN37681_c0_g1~~TRINITY_DN37681_c0_g1_i1.p1  ORF type:complete len:138 (+),score=19.41 TRINITY_DN37681_c0_g1_i1:38-451(+)